MQRTIRAVDLMRFTDYMERANDAMGSHARRKLKAIGERKIQGYTRFHLMKIGT